jgi:hypothetical protein
MELLVFNNPAVSFLQCWRIFREKLLPKGAHGVDALAVFAEVGQGFAFVNVSPQAG